jgi:uncharacterized protein YndB with AHSA1/START domain
MTTRKHVHEEVFDAGAATLFALIHTPSAIRQWWGASHVIVDQKEGGIWVAVWGDEDSPEFITAGRMSVFDPPRRIVFSDFKYYARSGPLPFAANLTSEFTVIPVEPHKTTLRVVQDGFPMDAAADEFYAGCERGWRDSFAGIRQYLSRETVSD